MQACVPKWPPIPYMVHYLLPDPYGSWSKEVHHIGNRVTFETQKAQYIHNQTEPGGSIDHSCSGPGGYMRQALLKKATCNALDQSIGPVTQRQTVWYFGQRHVSINKAFVRLNPFNGHPVTRERVFGHF